MPFFFACKSFSRLWKEKKKKCLEICLCDTKDLARIPNGKTFEPFRKISFVLCRSCIFGAAKNFVVQ